MTFQLNPYTFQHHPTPYHHISSISDLPSCQLPHDGAASCRGFNDEQLLKHLARMLGTLKKWLHALRTGHWLWLHGFVEVPNCMDTRMMKNDRFIIIGGVVWCWCWCWCWCCCCYHYYYYYCITIITKHYYYYILLHIIDSESCNLLLHCQRHGCLTCHSPQRVTSRCNVLRTAHHELQKLTTHSQEKGGGGGGGGQPRTLEYQKRQ